MNEIGGKNRINPASKVKKRNGTEAKSSAELLEEW